ncbi:MAG: hypothetical protein B7Z82_03990 [Halothiobacillus sp. 20-54-6]|nr:MAG: hypothetical protein B7Z82_03990 [Halothiobacillus sp. 20-54-6]
MYQFRPIELFQFAPDKNHLTGLGVVDPLNGVVLQTAPGVMNAIHQLFIFAAKPHQFYICGNRDDGSSSAISKANGGFGARGSQTCRVDLSVWLSCLQHPGLGGEIGGACRILASPPCRAERDELIKRRK